MDLEKVLIREINNDSRIFLYKEGDCWSAHDNSARHLCFLYSQFNAYDRIYQAYEIVLKCVMLSNAMIEKFIEHTLRVRFMKMKLKSAFQKKKEQNLKAGVVRPGYKRIFRISFFLLKIYVRKTCIF